MSQKIAILGSGNAGRALQAALSRASYEVSSGLDHVRAWERLLLLLGPRSGPGVTRRIGVRPIIFSVNCYIATILTMFVAFSLDLKSPGWAMTTVYLTSQPLSCARAAPSASINDKTSIPAAAVARTKKFRSMSFMLSYASPSFDRLQANPRCRQTARFETALSGCSWRCVAPPRVSPCSTHPTHL
jgi:hypothetical protein